MMEWLRKISCFLILMTVFLELTASESDRKYIRLFSGAVMILLVLSPAIRMFGGSGADPAAELSGQYQRVETEMEERIRALEREMIPEEEEESLKDGTGRVEWTGEESGGTEESGIRVEEIRLGELRLGKEAEITADGP